jgi:hypothetical protein
VRIFDVSEKAHSSNAIRGAVAAAEAQNAVTRTPGSHLRVGFARPVHPIAYGYPERKYVFRQNFSAVR